MQRVINRFTRIRAAYGISFTCLIVALLLTWYNNNRLTESGRDVQRALLVITKLEEMLSKTKDAETGYRGYLLTKDVRFLEPYHDSRLKTDSIYKDVLKLVPAQTAQREKLTALMEAIEKKQDAIEKGLITFQADTIFGFSVSPESLLFKQLMDDVRFATTDMVNAELEILYVRDEKVDEFQRYTRNIIWITILLATAMMLLGMNRHTKEISARMMADDTAERYRQQLLLQIDELAEANAQLTELQETEKLASIGRVAHVIAHEVRNPLTNIGLASGELRDLLPEPNEESDLYFEMIDRNAKRINELFTELLNSTKTTEINLEHEPVRELIDEVLLMAQDRITLHSVETELQICSPDIQVWMDFDKLKLACLNIVVNAIEAMKDKAQPKLSIICTETDERVVLSISDNGMGMDSETRARLFEPFFTGKSEGTGLGLTNTQNIVLNHKANLDVESELGEGTTFHIKLRKERPEFA